MGWNPNTLTEKQRQMIAPKDRQALGRAAITNEEATEKQADRLEKEIQKQLAGLLSRCGIEVISSGMHRKTSTQKGTPDFLFAVRGDRWDGGDQMLLTTTPVAWEIKRADGKRSKEQIEMARRMTTAPNAWHYREIRSYDEAVADLRQLGIHPL
jgi:hypothetical protein